MKRDRLFTLNFTLLLLGQISSLFGNYILRFSLSMYVLDVTGSATIFAGLLAMSAIPTILLSPLGGILADRANRRNIMVALDCTSGMVVLVAALWFGPQLAISAIGCILIAFSVLGAFESPTVQACVPQMHSGDNLTRANAAVNQVGAIAGLAGPILGGMMYAAFGLKPIMLVSIASFLLTALLECFIKLEYVRKPAPGNVFSTIKSDFADSMRFMLRDQPDIFRLLLITAVASFFIMGIASVGLPYIVRNVLGLGAEYYGAVESACGLSAILGSVFVSIAATKFKTRNLHIMMAAMGLAIIPMGIVFMLPLATMPQYVIIVAATCLMQFTVSAFSIFSLSLIQQKTPNDMIGKIMSYISVVLMCAQPLGQLVYGALFDGMSDALYLVLIPTGAIACAIGACSRGTFARLSAQPLSSASSTQM